MKTAGAPLNKELVTKTIAVIGGGAAGFFAAVNLAEKTPHANITIYEASTRVLQKVRISGGGRCNVTHHCFEPAELVAHYPRGSKELRSLFHRFQPKDTINWFETRRLKLKTESDGRMFPTTDDSEDVITVLMQAARDHGITVKTKTPARKVEYRDNQYHVTTQHDGELSTEAFDIVIMATGYSPPGWTIAESLGHKILKPVPSLFPFKISHPVIEGLQGISVKHAAGNLKVAPKNKVEKYQAEGPMLITHQGISGPVIYRLSAKGARALFDAEYQANLTLDLVPDVSEDKLRQMLHNIFMVDGKEQMVKNASHSQYLPQLSSRLWQNILTESGAQLEERGHVISKKAVNKIIESIKRLQLNITGKSPSKEEFVSCGGVSLKEVDFKTMESKLCPNLYFGGEILDIDGLTGGFNFQSCWSAGWVISESIAEKLNDK